MYAVCTVHITHAYVVKIALYCVLGDRWVKKAPKPACVLMQLPLNEPKLLVFAQRAINGSS